jgi:hypothetical protein
VCATGAELVSYGPFSTSNYLEQPFNDDYQVGTGSFSVSGWIKPVATASVQIIFHKRPYASNVNTIEIGINTDETLYFYTVDGSGNTSTVLTGGAIKTGEWQHFICTRAGNVMTIYLNGKFYRDVVGTARDTDNVDAHTRIGAYIGDTGTVNYPWQGEMALIKFTNDSISASQAAKIYNTEKVLFEPNAKALLYWDGVSTNKERITGLTFDPITNSVHAGNSSGRSEFQGLARVNNSTDAVDTDITARGGMVAEG